MGQNAIVIENLDTLLESLDQADLVAEWRVLPTIGPDWIGGGRFIEFYLGEQKLAENQFQKRLCQILIERLNIPEKSPDDREMMVGEGDILLKDRDLVIEFHWYKTVPYMHHHDSGGGACIFLALNAG
ncbi:MAG: hypothetical protein AAF902_12995 [Chloroflexota bacterium]